MFDKLIFLQVGTPLENLLCTALMMLLEVMFALVSAGQFAEPLTPQHLLLQDCIAMLLQFLFIQWLDRMAGKGGRAW